MAGKRNSLTDFLTRFPWWAFLLLPGAVYAALRFGLPGIDFGNPVLAAVGRAGPVLALPAALVVFVAGALGMVLSSVRPEEVDESPVRLDHDSVRTLSRRELERLVGEIFRYRGYEVQALEGGDGDARVDSALRKDGRLFLAQCRRWHANRVGERRVRELHEAMMQRGAAGGLLVTAREFTAAARRFALRRNIELIDGDGLVNWSETLRDSAEDPATPDASDGAPRSTVQESLADAVTPATPEPRRTAHAPATVPARPALH